MVVDPLPERRTLGSGAQNVGGIGEALEGPRDPDLINHPPHYTRGSIEPIDVIEDWRLGFCDGNALKYIARAKHKGSELEDLKKARWYLDRLIHQLEGA